MVRLIMVCVSLAVINLMQTGQSYAKIDPQTIVGMWLLDEGAGKDAGDSSENGHDGKVVGSEWVDGKFGKALEFNGKDDYVEVPDAENLDAIPQITVVTWARFDQFPPQHYSPVGKEPVYRFIIGQDGTGHFVVATGNNAWYSGGTVANGDGLKLGQWHHLAGTYDGTLVKFYIDGKFAGKGPQEISGDIVNNAAPFNMAKTIAGNVDYFEGIVDEVAVFSVALTDDDINSIATVGLEKAILGKTAVSPAGKLSITWAAIKAQY